MELKGRAMVDNPSPGNWQYSEEYYAGMPSEPPVPEGSPTPELDQVLWHLLITDGIHLVRERVEAVTLMIKAIDAA